MDRQWNDKIFNVAEAGFETLALEIFEFQYERNAVYRAFCDALGRNPQTVTSLASIPFLPVGFFKTHVITTTAFQPAVVFESSGTTGMVNSRHLVRDTGIYEESFEKGFERVYGPVKDLVIIGLLPSYLERANSSLVYMVDKLIARSRKPDSGFYLHNTDKLAATLQRLELEKKRSVLIGVTFALLDFAGSFPMPLAHCMIMETGGMKGRRQEMIRAEVQSILQHAFTLSSVHSEYGMTELLSQAYSTGGGRFNCPPWMKVLIREEEDPLSIRLSPPPGAAVISGAVNIIDLANIYSCSFIATDDAAKMYSDGRFEILGRLDNSDLRGCSLLTI
ncbi:MAG: acyl transferase [Chitinophagaceae bacterium]|nr:MAG: acyl transferase [Chitinophagaceae bacterium]